MEAMISMRVSIMDRPTISLGPNMVGLVGVGETEFVLAGFRV